MSYSVPDWTFLESLPEGLSYFAGIHSHARVFLKKPKVGLPVYQGRGRHPTTPRVLKGRTYTVREVARFSTKCPWSRVVLAEGAKGPIKAAVACMRVWPSRNGLPSDPALALYAACHRRGDQVCLFQCAHRYIL